MQRPGRRKKAEIERHYVQSHGGPSLEVETPVLDRTALTDYPERGPLIVEEYDTTVVVPPQWSALTNRLGNVILESLRR